jgi:predicted MFS family arabinose efflux permease
MALRWRTVVLLAFAVALNYADRTSLAAVFPLLRADLSLSDTQIAWIGTLFLWTYSFGSFWAGPVADRWPRHRVISLSLLGWSAVTLATAFVRTSGELYATRILLGLTECFYLPAAVALVADHHTSSSRGRAMAVHVCGLNAGLIGGGTLAGYLGEHYGWRSGPLLLGLLGMVYGVICWFALKQAPATIVKPRPVFTAPWLRLVGNGRFLLLTLQAGLISVGTWMFFNWMPLYFQERFGLSLAVAGFSGTAVLQLSTLAGVVLGGAISDKIAAAHPRNRLRMMTICYLIAAPCLMVFPGDLGMFALSAGVVAFQFFKAMAMANEPPALCELVAESDRGTAQSIMNTCNTLAGGVGVYIAGYLKQDFGLSGVFAGVGILVVIAAGLSWAVFHLRSITTQRQTA